MAKTEEMSKAKVRELAERMARVLESQHRLGGSAYPPTLERLAELSGVKASDPNVLKAAGDGEFKKRGLVAWNENKKPARSSPVLLVVEGDHEGAVDAAADALLLMLLGVAAESKTPGRSLSKLKERLTEKFKKPFQQAIRRRLEAGTLPPGVAWIPNGSSELLFLMQAVRTSQETGPPKGKTTNGSGDFGRLFREAFDRLDRENRSTNFVRLVDLRRALPKFDRVQFDLELRRLREAREFALDSHEGRHGPLSEEEKDAGIREAGSLLVYVSRRS